MTQGLSVSASTGISATTVIAAVALLVAIYGAFLSTATHRFQQAREQAKLKSDIGIDILETNGFDTDELVIGETVLRSHVLTVQVTNGGEAPEYVRDIKLENEPPSGMLVYVRRDDGTAEVRPRDQASFDLELDGSQAFLWDASFRVNVRVANRQQVFRSPGVRLRSAPRHGEPFVVPDPGAAPDHQVHRIKLSDLQPPANE